MDLHNTIEDIVISRVDEIFKTLSEEGNRKFCTCSQCRMDVICYALNRLPPHYIVSHRGASRTHRENIEQQQHTADISAMLHEGLIQVNENMRPNCSHHSTVERVSSAVEFPIFNIPTVMGRLFNGNNFSPVSGADLKLLSNSEMVTMKDGNWQNPYRLVSNAEGTFSFWPAPVRATKDKENRVFSYNLLVTSPEFETLSHFFDISVTSEIQNVASFSLERTFKLPDIYLFPPGEAEKNEG